MIGKKLYKGKFSNKEYADTACWCNLNNAHLEDKGDYFEVVENIPHIPTLKEQLIQLEIKYNMPRVIREGILGNPTAYSEFNVNRAKDLEDLAKKVRELEDNE